MKMKDWHVVPECYIDTSLTEFLLNSSGVNHKKGCNEVARCMKETNLKNQFSIGIIDNDKRKPSYVNEFIEIANTKHISLLKHRDRPHYLVMVSPAMDRFILDCSAELGVHLEEYGLPTRLEEFIKVTKDVKAKKDPRFKSLFGALIKAEEMNKLYSALNYLNENQYRSDTAELQKIFENK